MSCRFAVISDTHFFLPPTGHEGTWWNRTTHNYSNRMGEALVRLIKNLSVDFVIHCGDFTGLDSKENVGYGLEFMKRLGCPWFAVPGNHDTWNSETRNSFREIFDCGEDSWSYSREMGGLRFFFLDVVHWYWKDGKCTAHYDSIGDKAGNILGIGAPERDLLWLEQKLEETGLPSIIVSHAPIFFKDGYPLKTLPCGKPVNGPLTHPSDFIDDMVNRERLYHLTKKCKNLKVCFAGHWHINDAAVSDSVLYVMTGALREYPYEIRMVEYCDDSFKISTHALDVPELREMSYVKEWGNKWVEGGNDVREFVFTFRK